MSLIPRTPAPDVRRSLAVTANVELGTTCFCGDPSVDRLRDLIAEGVPQVEAPRLLWGPPPPREPDPEPPPRFRWIGTRERSC